MGTPSVFPNLAKGRVLVVGDVMLDRYWHGQVQRISPEAPVPVVGIEQDETRLGGAANVAANMATLTGKVHLMGLVGDDPDGFVLESMLRSQHIESTLRRVIGQRTTTKLRVLARNQQLIRLDFEQVLAPKEAEHLQTDLIRLLPSFDVVVFSDYAKGVLKDCSTWIKTAKTHGAFVIVDPKGNDFTRYHAADIITPNMSEFESVVGPCPDLQSLEIRARALCAQLGLQAVLVTRGEQGMSLVTRDQKALHLAAQAREVFDVTGAGDTVVATLALAIAAGCDLPIAVDLSNIAAGLAVRRVGTVCIQVADLKHAWHNKHLSSPKRHGAPSQICDLSQLLSVRARARHQGHRVVMTNGCFDVLHPGHVTYLEQARALGDCLVVAVNDDASVRRLKGPSRPINALSDRLRMLGALASVDWIIPFSQDTPETLISQVLPDILVKGGDYTPEQIAGADHVLAQGGQVLVLDHVPEYSSTAAIARIGKACHPF